MVWGSAVSIVVPIPLLVDCFYRFFIVPPDTDLKAFDEAATWILLIISSLFFTIGSWVFIRAFEEPPPKPFFSTFKHLSTDELLGAWLYLLAMVPSIPYSIVFLIYNYHRLTYWACFFASILFVLGCAFFVYSCYPSNHHLLEHETHIILPRVKMLVGERHWILTHVQTDWLAACWFFLFANACLTLGSYLFIFSEQNDRQMYVWTATCLDSFLFLIGSIYFVAGSYPPDVSSHQTDHDELAAQSLASSAPNSPRKNSYAVTSIVELDEPVVNVMHIQPPPTEAKAHTELSVGHEISV
jgi:hypothetical protein